MLKQAIDHLKLVVYAPKYIILCTKVHNIIRTWANSHGSIFNKLGVT